MPTSLLKTRLFDRKPFRYQLESGKQPLSVFKDALEHGRAQLRNYHFNGGKPQPAVLLHAWLVDQLLVQAWNTHKTLLPKNVTAALVAVGGYGRGELHPASDIDLMILLDHDDADACKEFVETLLRFCWDIGLEVGHSVRTVEECIAESSKDITVATNLMEARHLTGDAHLFKEMREKTSPPCSWPSKAFFKAKKKEQLTRHARFHGTAFNLEPNIKEGPGGLRDIQMIFWVATRHFNISQPKDLVIHKLLSKSEEQTLIKGRNFLWQLRNGLHYHANRREDRLLFDYQRILATEMGYKNRKGELAVEQLMKRYYRTVKELSLINEIVLQHFEEILLQEEQPVTEKLNRRFQARGNTIDVCDENTFKHAPYAMLELFLLMQQNPQLTGVSVRTIRQLRANLHRIDANYRRDITNRSLFLEILRQPQGLTHEFRRMNAYGVLAAYIPAFGKIVGQMQHDLFHAYTVDEHTLFVVRNLRRFTVPEFHKEFPLASSIITRLVKPERLYLAGLFHDIAKGRGGDHTVLGEHDAAAFCRLHDLSDYDTRLVCWLVRQHLIMSWTAQRQDISDPHVIMDFANKVGGQERLDNLYLLTVADMRGTSPEVWNEWKGHLLAQLYAATSRILLLGSASIGDVSKRVKEYKSSALALLKPDKAGSKRVDHFWANFENQYFLQYDADNLAWHARAVISAYATDFPVVANRFNPYISGTEFFFYTPDAEGLFVQLTSAFDALRLSIVDARLTTSAHGFSLSTFVVMDRNNKSIRDKRALQTLQEQLHDELLNPKARTAQPSLLLSRQLKHFPIETRVCFSESVNGRSTVMEVCAHDRPGLLYNIAQALAESKVILLSTKISTYGERAEDIFFITDRDHAPLDNKAEQDRLAKLIIDRLAQEQTSDPHPVSAVQF